jgi:hypothetical protein
MTTSPSRSSAKISAVDGRGDLPFERVDSVGTERPLIWGAAVESAESVERERFTSRRDSASLVELLVVD